MRPSGVSIVIAARNAEKTIRPLVEACRAQDWEAELEVVVVDDGSHDATARVAARAGARVLEQENRGPAGARNHGWRQARFPTILFTDSDCLPHADWVRRLVAALDERCAVATGSYGIANPESLLAGVIHAEIRWRHSRMSDEVDFAGSYNLAATRAALESIGGFDETYPEPSGEDNDLSYRLREAGHHIRFVPEAVVDHVHPSSIGRYLREQARHGRWRVALYVRHPARMRGDDYAGLLDFVGPPVALLALALALVSPAWPRVGGLALTAVAGLFGVNGLLALRVARHAGSLIPLALLGVGFLRDLARAWGLLRGGLDLLAGCGGRERGGA